MAVSHSWVGCRPRLNQSASDFPQAAAGAPSHSVGCRCRRKGSHIPSTATTQHLMHIRPGSVQRFSAAAGTAGLGANHDRSASYCRNAADIISASASQLTGR